eukprot:scaffold17499_cov112-Isochrysis_galbana.AAC.3
MACGTLACQGREAMLLAGSRWREARDAATKSPPEQRAPRTLEPRTGRELSCKGSGGGSGPLLECAYGCSWRFGQADG